MRHQSLLDVFLVIYDLFVLPGCQMFEVIDKIGEGGFAKIYLANESDRTTFGIDGDMPMSALKVLQSCLFDICMSYISVFNFQENWKSKGYFSS